MSPVLVMDISSQRKQICSVGSSFWIGILIKCVSAVAGLHRVDLKPLQFTTAGLEFMFANNMLTDPRLQLHDRWKHMRWKNLPAPPDLSLSADW